MSRRCCVVAAPHAQTARKENHNVNVRVLTRESSFNFPSVRPTAGRGPSHFTAAACGRQAPPWHGGRASAARVPGGRSAAGGRSGAAPAVLPHQPTAGPFFWGRGMGAVNYLCSHRDLYMLRELSCTYFPKVTLFNKGLLFQPRHCLHSSPLSPPPLPLLGVLAVPVLYRYSH